MFMKELSNKFVCMNQKSYLRLSW